MADLTGLFIFGTLLTGIFFILSVIMLILTGVRLKSASCSLLFVTMVTFTLTQLGGFLYYVQGATKGNQDPPKVFMYLFYLTSTTLILFVWVTRIKTTFQETQWAFSAKFMKTVYILVSIPPFLMIVVFITAVYVYVGLKIDDPASHPVNKVMFAFAALYLLFVIGLSIFLSYVFISKCMFLIKFKLEIEESNTNDDNTDMVAKLLVVQTKLTILVT
eukprot:720680_1